MEACPVCGVFLEVEELVVHVEEHFQEDDRPQVSSKLTSGDASTAVDAFDDDGVYCPYGCGEIVPLKDLDSHEEAHRAEELQEQLTSESLAAAEAAEKEEFARLQAKYGFTDKRPGKCYACGEEGHWSNECPNNAKKIAAREKAGMQLHSNIPVELVAQQRPEPFMQVHGGFIQLLASCLRSQPGAATSRSYLAGHVDHMCSGQFDRGFGCGYRNIQMLTSHLMMRSPQQREALFGGAGCVPTIGALQAWLEVAWQDGFDAAGAEQLQGQVRGSRKWIGTTEAAALLRYFGIQAHFVDFIDGSTTVTADGRIAHVGVSCDVCGASPIAGPRHKSSTLPDYDVCGRCLTSEAAAHAAPFFEVPPGGSASSSNPKAAGAASGASQRHKPLVGWVWGYFTGTLGPPPGGPPPPKPHQTDGEPSTTSTAASGVVVTGLPPLYFQHEGHSRTIVGIERRAGRTAGQGDEFNLLVMDPGVPTATMLPDLRSGKQWQRHIKRGIHTLRKAEYQLMYVADGVAEGAERERLKVLHTADRIS